MNPIKQLLVLCVAFFVWEASAAGVSRLVIEPIYGIETSLVQYPEPARYITRATYGGRVLYGITLLSGELEYTQAQSQRTYPSLDQKVEDKVQRLGVGIRSTLGLGRFLGIYGRIGARASEGETKITTAGVIQTRENPRRIDPYAGAGLQLAFSSNFALNAGVTMIQNAEKKYDSQYTLGLTARFGKL